MQLYFGHIWCYKTSALSPFWCMSYGNFFCCKRELKLATPFWALPKPALPTVWDNTKQTRQIKYGEKIPYLTTLSEFDEKTMLNSPARTHPLHVIIPIQASQKINSVYGPQPPKHRRLPNPQSRELSKITSSIKVFPPIEVLSFTWYQHTQRSAVNSIASRRESRL
jgi:hypothetical protein